MWTKEKQAEYYKKWRENNKEKLKQYYKDWTYSNKEKRKEYINSKSKIWRNNNKEKIKELWDSWYQNHKTRSVKRRFTEAKSKAKRRNLDWTLTLEEYSELISQPCFYCENKLHPPAIRATGLDRLDSSKGYIQNNVVSCCYQCNVIKNNFLTPEETKIAVEAILEYREFISSIEDIEP
jgi:hypothetical protein